MRRWPPSAPARHPQHHEPGPDFRPAAVHHPRGTAAARPRPPGAAAPAGGVRRPGRPGADRPQPAALALRDRHRRGQAPRGRRHLAGQRGRARRRRAADRPRRPARQRGVRPDGAGRRRLRPPPREPAPGAGTGRPVRGRTHRRRLRGTPGRHLGLDPPRRVELHARRPGTRPRLLLDHRRPGVRARAVPGAGRAVRAADAGGVHPRRLHDRHRIPAARRVPRAEVLHWQGW